MGEIAENIFINHSLGSVSYHPSFKTFKATPRTLHAPKRLYYMFRNYFYLNKKYSGNIFLEEKRTRRKDLLIRIKNNLIYGKSRITILKYLIKGWIDYKFTMNQK